MIKYQILTSDSRIPDLNASGVNDAAMDGWEIMQMNSVTERGQSAWVFLMKQTNLPARAKPAPKNEL